MKKKLFGLVITLCLCFSMSLTAFAEHYEGGKDWHVAFTKGKKMEQNFTESSFSDVLKGLQPGDDAEFWISLENQYPASTDWYMENEIIKSLEDLSANSHTAGGAYSYKLTYKNAKGEKVLFDSEKLGGDTISPAGEGLNEATDNLDEWFYLDTLKQGDKGQVYLYLKVDGETQNNDYQDTFAQLKARFAVELVKTGGDTRKIVRTGDTSNLGIYFALLLIAGLAIIGTLIYRSKKSGKEEV